jgi:hypothetical protein
MKIRLPAATLTILAALLLVGLSAAKATVVTYIDLLNTTQTNTTYNSSVTNTIASAGALGGFRTMTLTSSGNDINDEISTMRVMTNAAGGGPRMVLSSGNDVTATFQMTWGGAGGTAGLGGIDIFGGSGATNFNLTLSTLNFSLRTADLASPYTWSFTDTNNVTATYASTFPVNATPSIDYAISLASFANGGTIDWSAINFITLSGGGVPSLDLVLGKSFSVTATSIPEPGTWAAAGLLVLTAFYIRRRRMRATTEEAPAAA